MASLKKPPISDIDYVEFYANALKKNNQFFNSHKELINSQIKSSKELFLKMFGKGKKFKLNARKYLKERGIIKSKNLS